MNGPTLKTPNILFISNQSTATLRKPPTPKAVHSFSFVIALAAHLSYDLKLIPPSLPQAIEKAKYVSKSSKRMNKSRKDYVQLWCDYLVQAIMNGRAVQHMDTVIITAPVCDKYFALLHRSEAFMFDRHSFEDSFEAVSDICSLNSKQQINHQTNNRKIAIINFSSSVLNQDRMQPRIHLQGLLTGIFFNQGDKWKAYKILKKDIPTSDELARYDTVILSGSSHSVNTMPQPMVQFLAVLKETIAIKPELKLMGICFGHQFIAHLNNVPVLTRTLTKGPLTLDFQLSPPPPHNFPPYLFPEPLPLRIYKYHSDHVTSIPPSYHRFGTSQSCQIEGMVSSDHRVFSFQSHPEYTQEYISWYEHRLERYGGKKGGRYAGVKIERKGVKFDGEHHRSMGVFRGAIQKFLDWNCC